MLYFGKNFLNAPLYSSERNSELHPVVCSTATLKELDLHSRHVQKNKPSNQEMTCGDDNFVNNCWENVIVQFYPFAMTSLSSTLRMFELVSETNLN
jgi:hypothetical protein